MLRRGIFLANTPPVRRYSSAGGIVVRRPDGYVLVLLRAGRLGPEGRPEVRLPKGHIESGEDPQQTALREVHEEAGLFSLEVVAWLGRQSVEFDWQGVHYIRNETYYLMTTTGSTRHEKPERQFERQWLSWEHALSQLTFEAEREWLRRAHLAWTSRLRGHPRSEPQPDRPARRDEEEGSRR